MRIVIPWENNGIRLELVIQSRAVQTASKMQFITPENLEAIKSQAKVLCSMVEAAANNATPGKLD